MSDDLSQDPRRYKVVRNHEEQYSIWAAERENPPGWEDAGPAGSKEECLEYIGRTWTDMRPLSLRRQLERQGTDAGRQS